MDVDDDARTIGRRILFARKKSLVVVAGLAGISKSQLSRIERGERALDSRSQIVALANALEIAPSELTKLPVPAPTNGDQDTAVKAGRRGLIVVSRDDPAARRGSHAARPGLARLPARTPTCAGRSLCWRGRPPGNTAGPA